MPLARKHKKLGDFRMPMVLIVIFAFCSAQGQNPAQATAGDAVDGMVRAAAFSADATLLATSTGMTIVVREVRSGQRAGRRQTWEFPAACAGSQ